MHYTFARKIVMTIPISIHARYSPKRSMLVIMRIVMKSFIFLAERLSEMLRFILILSTIFRLMKRNFIGRHWQRKVSLSARKTLRNASELYQCTPDSFICTPASCSGKEVPKNVWRTACEKFSTHSVQNNRNNGGKTHAYPVSRLCGCAGGA